MSGKADAPLKSPAPDEGAVPKEVFKAIKDLVERESGIVLSEGNASQVRTVLHDRMRETGIKGMWDYVLLIIDDLNGREERKRFIHGMVIGETSFFRTEDHFRALSERLLPMFVSAGASIPLHLWSSGCATGEEPYSMAIAAIEAFRGRFVRPVRITATDIRPEFLAAAREGIYPLSSLRSLPTHCLKYFKPIDAKTVRVADDVRSLIEFREFNLHDFAEGRVEMGPFHVIFCRNVMIYFRTETTKGIVRRYHDALVPGGGLFLGHSETLWGISDDFTLERDGGAYFYRKRKVTVPAGPHASTGGASGKASGELDPADLVRKAEGLADADMLEEAERLLRQALSIDPQLAEAAYLRAVVLRRQGFFHEALRSAEDALLADSSFVMAGVEAAECLVLLDRKADAAVRWAEVYRQVEAGKARFPRLSPSAGFSAKAVREYVKSRMLR